MFDCRGKFDVLLRPQILNYCLDVTSLFLLLDCLQRYYDYGSKLTDDFEYFSLFEKQEVHDCIFNSFGYFSRNFKIIFFSFALYCIQLDNATFNRRLLESQAYLLLKIFHMYKVLGLEQ